MQECRHGRMLFLKRDRYIGRSLEVYGEFSELEAEAFVHFLRPGDVVIEAGANIGAHTVHIAKLVGNRGQVFAFEPQRVIHQLLCANLSLNELFHVRAFHAAVGRETGTINVPQLDYTAELNFGGLSLGGSEIGESVQVWKLDDLSLAALRMLKVDVEGMEVDVLAGAQQIIGKFRPILYVENDRELHSEQLITLIEEFDYDMWWHFPTLFNPNNFARNPCNIFEGIISKNLLCLPREAKAKIAGLQRVAGPKDWWPSKALLGSRRIEDGGTQ